MTILSTHRTATYNLQIDNEHVNQWVLKQPVIKRILKIAFASLAIPVFAVAGVACLPFSQPLAIALLAGSVASIVLTVYLICAACRDACLACAKKVETLADSIPKKTPAVSEKL